MSDLRCRNPRLILAIAAFVCVSGCSSFDSASSRVAAIVSPYKSDIVQGNVVTREQLALVKPGMQRAQVRDILGTALLVSVFHADRWDYVFTLTRQGVAPQSRKVTLFFKGDLLERTVADDLPSESEFVATLQSASSSSSKAVLEATEEQLKKFPLPSKPTAPSTAGLASPVEYPPLEAVRP